MLVDRFREIVKRVSEFRSEALLGRYVKALKMLEELQTTIGKLESQADPKLSGQFQQLKVVLEEEGKIVQQIYRDFLEKPIMPPIQNQRQEKQKHEPAKEDNMRKSEISKWSPVAQQSNSRKTTAISQSYVYQTKSKASKEFSEEEPRPLGNIKRITSQYESQKEADLSPELKDIIEEKLVLPFTMPKFFKRITNKVVLLFGPLRSGKRSTVLTISNKTSCKLQEIFATDLKAGAFDELSQLNVAANCIVMVQNIQILNKDQQTMLAKIAQRFRQNKYTKNILMLTSSSPQKINSDLFSTVCLQLRLSSGDQMKDLPYIEFEQQASQHRSTSDF